MAITYDPAKRERTLRERGLDFEHAQEVFASRTFDREDTRRDYGEVRIVTIGFLARSDARRRVDAARERSARHIDEEGQ